MNQSSAEIMVGHEVYTAQLTGEERKPNFHATYRGNCIHMLGEVVGPTTYGQLQVAIHASYEAVTDKTRVGFAPATEADIEAQFSKAATIR